MVEKQDPRYILRRLFYAALLAADPYKATAGYLPKPPTGRTLVVGAGKAAALMAKAVEDKWPGFVDGLVIVPYGHGPQEANDLEHIDVIEASHPVPDETGEMAAREILQRARALREGDLMISLISGGGSSLMVLPVFGIQLEGKKWINRKLLTSGATISEMNTVRRHLSAIKGGRLAAAAYPARTETIIISDVPGDEPATVASGPTMADPTTGADAIFILKKYEIDVPQEVFAVLEGPSGETHKPGDPLLLKSTARVTLRTRDALNAAKREAKILGIKPFVLGDSLEGEARILGQEHGKLAHALSDEGLPCVILSGGETTVTKRGEGIGGRNGEYLLAMALELEGNRRVFALAADTDGIDGGGANAGAVIDPSTLRRAAQLDMSAWRMLEDNDSFTFFDNLGDLVSTGPTRTNVNDFRAILIV